MKSTVENLVPGQQSALQRLMMQRAAGVGAGTTPPPSPSQPNVRMYDGSMRDGNMALPPSSTPAPTGRRVDPGTKHAEIFNTTDDELTKLMSREYAQRLNPIDREVVKAEILRRMSEGRANPTRPTEAPEIFDINGRDHIWDGQQCKPVGAGPATEWAIEELADGRTYYVDSS